MTIQLWEIWKAGRHYWLERANGRHEYKDQRCVASFRAESWAKAMLVADLFTREVSP